MIFELKVKKEIWYLILAYQNPNANKDLFLNKLRTIYECLISKGKEIIILHDFNIKQLESFCYVQM